VIAATVTLLLEAVFSVGSAPRLYTWNRTGGLSSSEDEEGLTSYRVCSYLLELSERKSVGATAPVEHIEPVSDDRGVWRISGMVMAGDNQSFQCPSMTVPPTSSTWNLGEVESR
jgi:hypothetical protein